MLLCFTRIIIIIIIIIIIWQSSNLLELRYGKPRCRYWYSKVVSSRSCDEHDWVSFFLFFF